MAKTTTDGDFYKNLDYIFKQPLSIPENQRPYVWKPQNAEDLWNDIEECFKKDTSLFFGTFIFYKENRDNPKQIVDGQQRITSIHLFVIAFKKITQEYAAKGLLTGDALHIPGLIYQSLQAKFTPSKQIEKIYDLMQADEFKGSFDDKEFIDENTINKEDSADDKRRKREINKQLKSIKKNYQYFYDNIRKIKIDELYRFYDSIYKISYCAVETEDISDAFDIFERTNNRGTPLHIADLIKNHLFKTEHVEKVDKNLSNRWEKLLLEKNNEPMIASKCKRWITTFHKTDHSFTRNDKKIIRELKLKASLNINTFLNRLEKYSKFFKLIDTKLQKKQFDEYENSKAIIETFDLPEFEDQRMMKIHWALHGLKTYGLKQMNPAIYCLFEKYSDLNCHDKKNKGGNRIYIDLIPDFLRNLESWHFKMTYIIGIQANEFEDTYHQLPKKITDCKNINELKNEIDDFFKILNKTENKLNRSDESGTTDFVRVFKRINYKEDKQKCTYILKRMTVVQPRDDDKIYLTANTTQSIIDNTNMDLDHWLAQKHKNQLEDNKKIHSIGNLLWIPKVLNSNKKKFGFGEKLPIEKIEMVQKEDFQEIKDAPVTLKNFVKKYHTDNQSNDWGINEINKRCEDLATDCENSTWIFKQKITEDIQA